jgi:hypothetical protein
MYQQLKPPPSVFISSRETRGGLLVFCLVTTKDWSSSGARKMSSFTISSLPVSQKRMQKTCEFTQPSALKKIISHHLTCTSLWITSLSASNLVIFQYLNTMNSLNQRLSSQDHDRKESRACSVGVQVLLELVHLRNLLVVKKAKSMLIYNLRSTLTWLIVAQFPGPSLQLIMARMRMLKCPSIRLARVNTFIHSKGIQEK